MMKQYVNLQDVFLNKARKDNIAISVFLINGNHLDGTVEGFDSYTIILKTDDKQHLIYKHAISTIIPMDEIEL